MDDKSIRAFARAAKAMGDALQGHVDEAKLELMFDDLCSNPVSGIVEYVRLARANHVLTKDVQDEVGKALDDVETEEGERHDLTTEEQGTLMVEWLRSRETMTVPQAVRYLGISRAMVNKAVRSGWIRGRKEDGGRGGNGHWVLDARSVRDYQERTRKGTGAGEP